MAIIMVPGNTPGIQIEEVYETVGHRAVNCPQIKFENVRVPTENLIGKPGDGVEIALPIVCLDRRIDRCGLRGSYATSIRDCYQLRTQR